MCKNASVRTYLSTSITSTDWRQHRSWQQLLLLRRALNWETLLKACRGKGALRLIHNDIQYPCSDHAVTMPCPCLSPAMPWRVNSPMRCRVPDTLRQCRVFRESPRRSWKYSNCKSYNLTDFRGTLRGSRKKPNAGRSPTCSLWTADANSHMTWPCSTVSWPWEAAFRTAWSCHCTGVAWVRHGRDMGTAWNMWI
jgi:hypothetical protein